MAAAAPSVAETGDGAADADVKNYSTCLVIGGGLSGLSAASHLSRNGLDDYRLLEARNRLGGRVISVQIGSTKVELGASWIHGVLGNPLYELAVSKGLVNIVQTPKPHNVVAVSEDGKRLPFSILQEIYEAYFWFFKRCEEYYLCKFVPPPNVTSVGQHIDLEIDIYLQRFPPQQRYVRRLVFDYLLKREACISGESMDTVDLLAIGSYTELPGGNITLPNGYSSILVPIMASIPEANILKQHAVTTIHWQHRADTGDRGYESEEGPEDEDGAGVTKSSAASSARSSRTPSVCGTPLHAASAAAAAATGGAGKPSRPNVMVECSNGERFYADHVICTVPLGILKERPDLFDPPLPEDKREALARLQYGTVDKIFLEYERPFLSQDIAEVILLWDRIDEKHLPMRERWFRKIYSFSKASETVLVGWISGEEARFMETLKMNVVAETCTAILKRFLADPHVPRPRSCIFTAWHSQPYSRGSYSSIGLGGQQTHIEKVAEPLYQRPGNSRTPAVVSFAGEHCHPSFYSTGHGAFLTGRTSAQVYLNAAAAAAAASGQDDEEDVYNLGAASVADLSTWLQEVSLGSKSLDDYRAGGKAKKEKADGAKGDAKSAVESSVRRDDGIFATPR